MSKSYKKGELPNSVNSVRKSIIQSLYDFRNGLLLAGYSSCSFGIDGHIDRETICKFKRRIPYHITNK